MKKLLLVLVLALSAVGRAQETVTLTSPITHPNVTGFTLTKVTWVVDPPASASVYIEWKGQTGEAFAASYPTPAPSDHPSQPTGVALLNNVNKPCTSGPCQNKSMMNRIIQELQADGYIGPGTISGSVQ